MVNTIDRVNLVDDQDRIIGSEDKTEAHRGKALLHQAISLYIFRKSRQGIWQLLLQRRGRKKIVGANLWANTLCANVRPGETHIETIKRRLREELGLDYLKMPGKIRELCTFRYQIACENDYSENEIDHFFALFLSEKESEQLFLKPNPAEVINYSWVDWLALKNKDAFDVFPPTPWFRLFMETDEIINCMETAFFPDKKSK